MMAKATHAQEVATGSSESFTEEEAVDPAVTFTRPQLGLVDQPDDNVDQPEDDEEATGRDLFPVPEDEESDSEELEEEPLAGGSSTQSLLSENRQDETNMQLSHKPAPTMVSPFNPTGAEDSAASSTDGDGQRETRKPSGRARKAPGRARVRNTDEVDEFDI